MPLQTTANTANISLAQVTRLYSPALCICRERRLFSQNLSSRRQQTAPALAPVYLHHQHANTDQLVSMLQKFVSEM